MLVITRSTRESFRIGSNVSVTVLSVDKNKVRIGIDAPKEVPILRSELVGKEKKRD